MIKNIVFDMGQVMIRWQPEYYLGQGNFSEEDKTKLLQEVFRSVEWVQMDRGSLCEAEAYEKITARLPERLHDAAGKLIGMWDRPILEIDGMYELVAELKEMGYGIYLLSNASIRQHDYWPKIPGWQFFDGKVISADEKVMKPHPDYYRIALKRLDLKPEECFFIDDNTMNIEAARCCGMAGTVFRGDMNRLKRCFASLATTSGCELCHIVGCTAEAPTLEAALMGHEPQKHIVLTQEEYDKSLAFLCDKGSADLQMVVLGCPHYSLEEIRDAAELLKGRKVAPGVSLQI